MVGRITSARCATCRQRKVKCDLLRPSCSQCIKVNRACPGYDTHSRFHTVVLAKRDAATGKNAPRCALTTSVDTLRSEFVFKYTHSGVAARLMVVPETHLLQHLPPRLGHNSALDDAVRCICSSRQPRRDTPLAKDEHAYLSALRSLQNALNDADTSMTSETLAAATLLQMYEHFMDDVGWVVHANGVIKMLELRGPSKIQNEIDESIVLAQVGNIFMNALRGKKSCFLAGAEWSAVLQAHPTSADDIDQCTKNENVEMMTMINIGIHIPGVLSQFDNVWDGMNPQMTSVFLQDLLSIREKLQDWMDLYLGDPARASSTKRMALMRSSSQITIPVFLALVNYMFVNILSPEDGLFASSQGMRHISPEVDLDFLSEQCKVLLAPTKSKWLDLMAMDKTAGACSNTLLVLMLSRIVNGENQANGHNLRFAFEDLYAFLSEHV